MTLGLLNHRSRRTFSRKTCNGRLVGVLRRSKVATVSVAYIATILMKACEIR
jgi:hypothetical protein